MMTISPCRSAKWPGCSRLQPSEPKKNGSAMSSASARAHTRVCAQPSRPAATTMRPTPTAVPPARPRTDWRRAGLSRLAIRNRPIWEKRTTPYAHAKSSASSPNAPGTQRATTSNAAIATNITSRTPPSSGSSTLVSQAYPTHAHQRTPRTSRPLASPAQVGSSAISAVHCVIARTKTRSKKSSSGVTRSVSRNTAEIRGARGEPDTHPVSLLEGSDSAEPTEVVPASRARPVALRGCSRRLLLPLLFRVEQLVRAARLDVEVQVVARDADDDLVAGLHAPAQHQP